MKTLQFIVKSFGGICFLFLILFVSAGRIDYWQAWLFLILHILMTVFGFSLMRNNIELINERFNPSTGTKWWDFIFMIVALVNYILILIIAGIDVGRFHLSPRFHYSIYIVGIFLIILGQSIFHFAKKQNHFFSSVVRIQADRGHKVCDVGLYKKVRHPGYLGAIISTMGFPLVLGSVWCIIPSICYIILFLIRTYFEDLTLIDELSGYHEYSSIVRYRIFRGVW
ncbi:MAG: methyltransferase family protein [Draconibacterium sp.]